MDAVSRRRTRPLTTATVLVALLAVAVGCASEPATDGAAPSTEVEAAAPELPPAAEPELAQRPDELPDGPPLRVTQVASLPTMATAIAAQPGSDELLVGDRRGVVRRMVRTEVDGHVVPELEQGAVLDLSDEVTLQFDRGFLDMALVEDGRSLVTMYTGLEGETRIEQFPYETGRAIDPDQRRVLADLHWEYPFHHGGGFAVDDDGNLLIGIGDKGISLPILPAPQDPELFNGGIAEIPAEVLADPEATWDPTGADMLARGLRNPWRLAIDPATGDLWIGDVGNLLYEELDRIDAEDLRTTQPNFGHPYYEGLAEKYARIPDDVDLVPPFLPRARAEDVCGMVAGAVVRSDLLPELDGQLLYGDLCGGAVRAVGEEGGEPVDDRAVADIAEPFVSFGVGPSGEIYGLGYVGGVYRLDPAWWTPPDDLQTSTDPPVPDEEPVDTSSACEVFQIIEPLDQIGALEPPVLEERLGTINDELAATVPELPEDVRPAGEIIQQMFADLADAMEAVGWNALDPRLEGMRQDILNAEGIFDQFPQAIVAFSESGCQ